MDLTNIEGFKKALKTNTKVRWLQNCLTNENMQLYYLGYKNNCYTKIVLDGFS